MSLLTLFALLPSLLCVDAFVHPGLLVTSTSVDRIASKLSAGKEPWKSSWDSLTSISYSQPNYTAQPVAELVRSTEGYLLWHDAAAAFNLALRWQIEGDDDCAQTAADILTAWANTLVRLETTDDSDDRFLTAGLQGYQLANAAEMLRDFEPFQRDGLSSVKTMLSSVFLDLNIFFLNHLAPSEHNVLHFFANWELANMASAMAIGVATDNQTAYDFVVNYFKTGDGNGAINNTIYPIHTEEGTGNPLGQGQESGRDQGHSALDFEVLGVLAQQAWAQGDDLFGYDESRILSGAEYFAKYNLGHDVPFEPYDNGIVSYDVISDYSRGGVRPTWELYYAHYGVIRAEQGLSLEWTTQYLNKSLENFGGVFEPGAGSWGEGSGHYDGLGWGSLLYRLDAGDAYNAPMSSGATISSHRQSTSWPTATSSVRDVSSEAYVSAATTLATSSQHSSTTSSVPTSGTPSGSSSATTSIYHHLSAGSTTPSVATGSESGTPTVVSETTSASDASCADEEEHSQSWNTDTLRMHPQAWPKHHGHRHYRGKHGKAHHNSF